MAIDKIVAEYRLELDGLRQDVNNLKGQLKSVDDTVNKSADNTNKKLDDIGNNVGGKLPESFKRLGAAIAAAFAVERIANFAVEAVNLAAKAEGIKSAFDKLNDPTLLRKLQQAVNGTVGDIELMQAALRANNFKIPLQDLTNMFKFAKIQSDLTGRSVTELANTIIDSIGKGSVRALNELGVKQEEINAAVVETGSVYAGTMKIINDGLALASEQTETFSDKQAQLRVEFEKIKEQIGEALIPTFEALIDIVQQSMTNYGRLLDKMTGGSKLFNDEYDKTIEHANEHNMTLDQINEKISFYFQKSISTFGDEQKINSARLQAYTSLRTELEKSGKTQLDNNQAVQASNTQTQAQIGLLEQLQQEIENLTELQKKSNDPAEIKKYAVEIDKLQNRIKDLTTVTKSNAKTFGDLEKQTTDLIKTTGPVNETLISLYLGLSDAQQAMASGDVVAYNKALDGMASIMVALADEDIPALKKALGELKDTNKETTEDATEKWNNYFNGISGLASGFNELSNSLSENRIAQLESELNKGLISQEQYDAKLKEIQKEQAKRDKAFRVFQAIIGSAQSIINAATSTPFNPALIALAAATGIAQTAAIVSAPLPKFKDGVIDLKGKGTETSDSNLALLSKGESVITAKATRKHKDALEAIQKDRFDEYVMQIYAKQIKDKQKDTAIGWDEYFYRQYLLQNKLISATERQGDKVSQAVKELPKRHRFQ